MRLIELINTLNNIINCFHIVIVGLSEQIDLFNTVLRILTDAMYVFLISCIG